MSVKKNSVLPMMHFKASFFVVIFYNRYSVVLPFLPSSVCTHLRQCGQFYNKCMRQLYMNKTLQNLFLKNRLTFDMVMRLCVVISPSAAGEPLAVDVRSPMSNGVLSPSSTPSSIGWDSRTPLIRNSSPSLDNAKRLVLQLPSSPVASVDSLGGATDTTELDNYPWDSPDAATPLSMLLCATGSGGI